MRELSHGTYTSYKSGCRCDDCKAAYAERRQRERDAKRLGSPDRTYTGPVSQATRIQRPAGWPETAFDRLERAL